MILLAFVAFKGFKLCQINVKNGFINCVIQEEVFVSQPPGFKNHKYPDRMYKLLKTLYGLKQVSRTWYALEYGFLMGCVNKTLFTLNHDNDFLLVQIYVDDIIFGASSHVIVSSF
jgi:hypothetical protein